MPAEMPKQVAIFLVAALSVAFRGVTPEKAFREAEALVKLAETETPNALDYRK